MNKKGMFLTIMTIAFLTLFLFLFMTPTYTRLSDRMSLIELRVDAMNDFIKDVSRDTERGLFIASYRALLALEEYIIINGVFVNSTSESFKDALMNGTVYGQTSSIMVASTFPDWVNKIELESQNFNINTNITIHDVSLSQNSPWQVNVAANLTMRINDAANLASWTRDELIITSIDIESFEDPIYIIYSLGRISNVISRSPHVDNYTQDLGGTWDVANLLDHANNSYYAADVDAPSFLMRFENNLTGSPYGIESLVNLKKVGDLGLQVFTDTSIVDFYYWIEDGNGDFRINFTPSWFKLDTGHLGKYNTSSISYLS